MLKLVNIRKVYGSADNKVEALKGVSLEFRKSEFVAVLGASGCGKTTLLNIIGGLDRYTDGELFIEGRSTKDYADADWDTYRNNSIGFVFQSYNLIPHLSVLANVEMALTLAGVSKEIRKQKAVNALTRVGLADQIKKRPNQLSGGQMQRVAIARALVNDPQIILADEPTGALDSETGMQTIELLKEVALDRLVVMVTHNSELAARFSNRIIRLHDGCVVDDSNPHVSEDTSSSQKTKKKKRIAMSLLTAISLSLRNLMTKKGRTFMTSFAGSIGIFGIALILAISNGMSNYIDSVQTDSMSQSPVTIDQVTIDLDKMQGMRPSGGDYEEYPENAGGVYPYEQPDFESMLIKNNITQEYLDYVAAIDPKLVNAVTYERSVNMNFICKAGEDYRKVSTEDAGWQEILSNEEYLEGQVKVLAGERLPTAYNELAIVVDRYNRLSTKTLNALGISFDARQLISYDALLNKEFKLILNDDFYTQGDSRFNAPVASQYGGLYNSGDAVTLKIISVIRIDRDAAGEWLDPGLVYSPALTDFVLDDSRQSQVALAQVASTETDVLTGLQFNDSGILTSELIEELYKYSLQKLGASSIPSSIKVYAIDFESKQEIIDYLKAWNTGKAEKDKIIYTDMSNFILGMVNSIVKVITYILIAFSAISLLVSSIMIGITTYVSVIERTKEIGVLRSLGARKKDVSRVFNAETLMIGMAAGLIGVAFTLILSIPLNIIIFKLADVQNIARLEWTTALVMIGISMLLTLIAGFIPSRMAAKKDPVAALRSE
ncbi:MAG: ATP-binding cassette domain-containing protein [Clostridia bacterium]|nr:ATP-binding cassette domain-containing protein [Clostridia bacterium]